MLQKYSRCTSFVYCKFWLFILLRLVYDLYFFLKSETNDYFKGQRLSVKMLAFFLSQIKGSIKTKSTQYTFHSFHRSSPPLVFTSYFTRQSHPFPPVHFLSTPSSRVCHYPMNKTAVPAQSSRRFCTRHI